MAKKTKIIATIGPASNKRSVIKELISAGMNVARLNFSHSTYENHGEVIKIVRSLSKTMDISVGILADLQGPKIRTGRLKDGEPVFLKKNKEFSITSRKVPGSSEIVSTTYRNLPYDVKKNDKILIDDGLIELKVISSTKDTVTCKVLNGGVLKENKGINLPGVKITAPSLTEKDKRDLNFSIKMGVDFLALSFVRTEDDLKLIKSIMKKQGKEIPVIAKIEKPEAVDNLNSILEAADGIMVARGDLGVELRPEQVPTIQKQIIHAAADKNKPVITATQMLESMTVNLIPTRAEASDVANAILDGTDAVMLSGETASGKYPVKAVQMMSKIALQVERSPFMRYNVSREKDPKELVQQAVAQSAVNILHEVGAKGIVAFSASGSTSKLISKYRPSSPVFAFTPSSDIYNRLSLLWGITPLYISEINDAKRLVQTSEDILIEKKLFKKGDLIVIVIGKGLKKGSTNLIKIHRIGHDD